MNIFTERGDQMRLIDEKYRTAGDLYITVVPEIPNQHPAVCPSVLRRILLLHQNLVFTSIPSPGPVFVGPTEHEREIRLAGCQHLFRRPLQQAFSVEPIMIVAETLNAILLGQVSLCLSCLRQSEIVK